MNRLQETKPMVWMTDICWNEMEVDHELTSHSHHYHIQIKTEEDIEKIQMPKISHNEKKSTLAMDNWHPDQAREELETKLNIAKAHHCQAEVIMKDISTGRYEPQRLWEWAKIASEVTQQSA